MILKLFSFAGAVDCSFSIRHRLLDKELMLDRRDNQLPLQTRGKGQGLTLDIILDRDYQLPLKRLELMLVKRDNQLPLQTREKGQGLMLDRKDNQLSLNATNTE